MLILVYVPTVEVKRRNVLLYIESFEKRVNSNKPIITTSSRKGEEIHTNDSNSKRSDLRPTAGAQFRTCEEIYPTG
jgi:hypothetical protein